MSVILNFKHDFMFFQTLKYKQNTEKNFESFTSQNFILFNINNDVHVFMSMYYDE